MNDTQTKYDNTGGLRIKVLIVWLAILLLASFWLTVKGGSDPISMAIVPQVPREGEPVIVIFRINNPSHEVITATYMFFANGELIKEGKATIIPGFSKTYKYVYENRLPPGEQINFVVRTKTKLGNFQQIISTPPYPPQIWSSFISFASFSTTVMSFMATMSYYESAFGASPGFNIGLIMTGVLATLLIFLELSQPLLENKSVAVLGRLRLRFNTMTWILLIIFMGIVYTKVVIIIAG